MGETHKKQRPLTPKTNKINDKSGDSGGRQLSAAGIAVLQIRNTSMRNTSASP